LVLGGGDKISSKSRVFEDLLRVKKTPNRNVNHRRRETVKGEFGVVVDYIISYHSFCFYL